MTISQTVGTAGSGKQVTRPYVGTAGSGVQAAVAGYVGTAGSGVQQFFAALTASVSPTSATASAYSGHLTTGSVTASPAGGVGPYTYSWALSAASGPTIIVNSSTSASTNFSATISAGQTAMATATCTITDAATGATAQASASVVISSTA